jgi:hypothetical protein
MAINHGRLTIEPIVIEGKTYGMPMAANGKRWKDHVKEKKGHWFIAVTDDGTIISAEPDPTQSVVTNCDIWQIEHPGPAEAIRGKRWDGENAVPIPMEP